jgi:hypothetical protein
MDTGFSLVISRVNASLGGTHCETFQKTTYDLAVLALLVSFRPACMFWGFGNESAPTSFLRCFTRGAGTPPSLLSSLRAPGNLLLLRSLGLASQVSRGRRGHGDEGARGVVSDGNISDWIRQRRTAILFFCLSLHEYPGDTGSIIRHTARPFRQHWNRY